MNVIMLETGRLNPYANNPRRNDGAVDPKYVDVIIKRWENLTGSKAVKIN